MIGLGTIVNAGAIILGGFLGLFSRKLLSERCQETMIKAMGFATMVMALGSTLSKMLTVELAAVGDGYTASLGTGGEMMMIISMAVGALLGELADFERRFEDLGVWLRDKSGSSGDSEFVNAFMTASLTVCVGAMAVLGSIQDGLNGDHNTLFAKAVLDLVIVAMMSASLGKGCMFSAVPVALWQGSITLLSRFIAPIMTDAALANISYVGNVLIFCVGVNLVFPKTVRVANLLPALLIAVLFAL